MAQYIDKNALVKEIERRINGINLDTIEDWHYRLQWEHDIEIMKNILSLIDTLEVKEVDLEKEIDLAMPSKYCWSGDGEAVYTKEQMRNFARYFFERGLKLQKGE